MGNQHNRLDSELPSVCSTCGTVVDQTEWHPTRTKTADEDEPEIHVFCDGECLEDWTGG